MGSSIEVSIDNSTWKNANIVSAGNIASVVGLQCDTIYYFRIIDGAGYEYEQTKTNACGLSEMEIAILIFFGILILVFGALTIMSKSVGMKGVWGLLTGLIMVIGLFVTAKLAEANVTNQGVVNVLWTVYRMSLYLYLATFFLVLAIFTTMLVIQKNKPPTMGSPLQDSEFMRR
jgi:hypothetical protein